MIQDDQETHTGVLGASPPRVRSWPSQADTAIPVKSAAKDGGESLDFDCDVKVKRGDEAGRAEMRSKVSGRAHSPFGPADLAGSDAADRERSANELQHCQAFAEQEPGEQNAEDRDQVREHCRPPRADARQGHIPPQKRDQGAGDDEERPGDPGEACSKRVVVHGRSSRAIGISSAVPIVNP